MKYFLYFWFAISIFISAGCSDNSTNTNDNFMLKTDLSLDRSFF